MTAHARAVTVAVALALLLALPTVATAAEGEVTPEVTLKLGSLAPVNSLWMKIFKKAAAEIKTATGGAVVHKLYGGGTMGDEEALVSKMRAGQLDMAAITAVGLGEVAQEVLVLQVPGLITDYATLDKVRDALKGRFEQKFLAKEFVLLGWGDVGQLYVFSKHKVVVPDDFQKTSLWAWRSDPVTREVAKVVNVTPKPVGVPQVLPGLNTGNIDTVIVSPLACIQLQWCNYVSARTNRPFGVGIGAVVISQKSMARMKPEHAAVVTQVWAKWSAALTQAVRKMNDKAGTLLAKKGIEDVPVSAAQEKLWEAVAQQVQENLVGKVYDRALLEDVRKLTGSKK